MFGRYPTVRSAGLPSLKMITVGIDMIPYFCAVCGFSSTLSLTIFTLAPSDPEISSSAGAIIRQGLSVRGLTTAATLWLVAAIGMAAGAGYYSAAVIATVGAILTLGPLRIATFKIPRYWKFVDAFPMTVTGKIQKYRMREISTEELGLGAARESVGSPG